MSFNLYFPISQRKIPQPAQRLLNGQFCSPLQMENFERKLTIRKNGTFKTMLFTVILFFLAPVMLLNELSFERSV